MVESWLYAIPKMLWPVSPKIFLFSWCSLALLLGKLHGANISSTGESTIPQLCLVHCQAALTIVKLLDYVC